MLLSPPYRTGFCFDATPTTEIYTLSLHDALPIWTRPELGDAVPEAAIPHPDDELQLDRKSTRLNSSHITISYAVFCLKKKKKPLTTKLLTPMRDTYRTHPK